MPVLRDRKRKKPVIKSELIEEDDDYHEGHIEEDEEGDEEDLDEESDGADDSGFFNPNDESAVVNLNGPPGKKRKSAVPTRQRTKQKKATKVEEAEPKPFPFLQLPPELRNNIYELTLMDDERGMPLVNIKRLARRFAKRRPVYSVNPAHYTGWRNGMRPRLYAEGPTFASPNKRLVPALLRVSKQINLEACPILYGQRFIFQDTKVMETFLSSIGLGNRKLLLEIVLKHWDSRSVSSSQNHSAFTWLQDSVNLRSLHLDCPLGNVCNVNARVNQVYSAAHRFFEYYGAAKGSKTAALDIIHFADSSFERHMFYSWHARTLDDEADVNKQKFLTDLTDLVKLA